MALVARAQTEALGGPQHLKRLAVQFRGAAVPEEEITITSTVTARDGNRLTVSATATQRGKAIIRAGAAELER